MPFFRFIFLNPRTDFLIFSFISNFPVVRYSYSDLSNASFRELFIFNHFVFGLSTFLFIFFPLLFCYFTFIIIIKIYSLVEFFIILIFKSHTYILRIHYSNVRSFILIQYSIRFLYYLIILLNSYYLQLKEQ